MLCPNFKKANSFNAGNLGRGNLFMFPGVLCSLYTLENNKHPYTKLTYYVWEFYLLRENYSRMGAQLCGGFCVYFNSNNRQKQKRAYSRCLVNGGISNSDACWE